MVRFPQAGHGIHPRNGRLERSGGVAGALFPRGRPGGAPEDSGRLRPPDVAGDLRPARDRGNARRGMRVALVTFEFPPDTPYGGIATYMTEVADMLAAAGHEVEVFCAGHASRTERHRAGVPVHIVAGLDKDRFAEEVRPVFAARHAGRPFDIIECADINGDGRVLREAFPEVPLVIKMHGPTFLCVRVNHLPLTLGQKLRFTLGALRRGRFAWLNPDQSILHLRNRREQALYRTADVVASPSRDMIPIVENEWGRRPEGIVCLPNPHSPSAALLAVPPPRRDEPILFLGRLELLKGAADLIEALRLLERSGHPVSATFVGAPFPSPRRGLNMEQWAARRLRLDSGRYRFTGPVPRAEIAGHFGRCQLVVLPSRWDNFPYTCLEAMAAGRAVIAGANGGMRDMIADGVSGLLVNPSDPKALAARIAEALARPERLAAIGDAARQRVITVYSAAAILPRHLGVYEQARAAAHRRRSVAAAGRLA
ncbi:MAG: hypothetical protein C0502_00340 [Opitutus sp.]|nr:hypothetical protein [Opitutus sp.]